LLILIDFHSGNVVRVYVRWNARSENVFLSIFYNDTDVSLPPSRWGDSDDSKRHPTPNGPERKQKTDKKLFNHDDMGQAVVKDNMQEFQRLLAAGGIEPFAGLTHFMAMIGTASFGDISDIFSSSDLHEFPIEKEIIDGRDWDTAEVTQEPTIPSKPEMGSFLFYASALGAPDKISGGNFSEFFRPGSVKSLSSSWGENVRPKSLKQANGGTDLLATLPDDALRTILRFIFPVATWRSYAPACKRFRNFLTEQLLHDEQMLQNEAFISYSRQLKHDSRRIVLLSIENALHRALGESRILNSLETELLIIAEKANAYQDTLDILKSVDQGLDIPAGPRETLCLEASELPAAQKFLENCPLDILDAYIFNRTDFESYQIEMHVLYSFKLPPHQLAAQGARILFVRVDFNCYGGRGDEEDNYNVVFSFDDPSQLLLRKTVGLVAEADRCLRDNHFSIDMAMIGAPGAIARSSSRSSRQVAVPEHSLFTNKNYNASEANFLLGALRQHGFEFSFAVKPGQDFHPLVQLLIRIGMALDPSYYCYTTF
jgi:hypothetical protein